MERRRERDRRERWRDATGRLRSIANKIGFANCFEGLHTVCVYIYIHTHRFTVLCVGFTILSNLIPRFEELPWQPVGVVV